MSTPLPSPFQLGEHFIAKLAVEVAYDGTTSKGSAPVRPELFAPGTRRIRTGALVTMVDVVAGHAPNGTVGPTVDIRVQVVSTPPSEGCIRLACRPLRVGKRLIVAETTLHAESDPVPFARATTTFMNNLLGMDFPAGPRPLVPIDEGSFDDLIGARVRDARSMELDPAPHLANGLHGTVQGGVQSLLAEMTAEHALGGGRRMVASDLDIRYLDRCRVGPLVATATELAGTDDRPRAVVVLTDGGTDQLVSHVSLTLTPATPAP
jgi:acyl-coenzyme A thioesterase PaaI-like protein